MALDWKTAFRFFANRWLCKSHLVVLATIRYISTNFFSTTMQQVWSKTRLRLSNLMTTLLWLCISPFELLIERCSIILTLLRNTSLECFRPRQTNLLLHVAIERRKNNNILIDSILFPLSTEFVLHVS